MCNYWKMILGLQLEILLFVRPLRESNFQLHLLALAHFIKWFFAMIYYKYARWGSVGLSNLSNPELTAPSLYEELDTSKLDTLLKRLCIIFLALHQIKFNEKIKRLSWATHLLNRLDSTGLKEWETSSPELVLLLS